MKQNSEFKWMRKKLIISIIIKNSFQVKTGINVNKIDKAEDAELTFKVKYDQMKIISMQYK